MLRYALLRLLVFFAALAVLWLVGLRGREDLLLLVVGAALLSAVVSFVALRRFREDTSAQIAERLEQRAEARRARAPKVSADDAAEDAEVEQRQTPADRPGKDPAEEDDFR